jgi:hypothetical protein
MEKWIQHVTIEVTAPKVILATQINIVCVQPLFGIYNLYLTIHLHTFPEPFSLNEWSRSREWRNTFEHQAQMALPEGAVYYEGAGRPRLVQ